MQLCLSGELPRLQSPIDQPLMDAADALLVRVCLVDEWAGAQPDRPAVEVDGGSLTVRDVPGIGCVFTISLPRHSLA